jgi:hypothetical protein
VERNDQYLGSGIDSEWFITQKNLAVFHRHTPTSSRIALVNAGP